MAQVKFYLLAISAAYGILVGVIIWLLSLLLHS